MMQRTHEPDSTHRGWLPERHDYRSSFFTYLQHTTQWTIAFSQHSPLCRVIQNIMSNRIFYVELNNDRSRWRNQKNGLAQVSLLSPILFNKYTNDQPLHDGTRNFIYADDLCVTIQYPSFTEVENTIEEGLDVLTTKYISNSLRANPDKTQVTSFHMKNREAKRTLKVN